MFRGSRRRNSWPNCWTASRRGFEYYRPFLVQQPDRYSRMPQLPMELLKRVLRETRWRNPEEIVAADRLYEWLGVVSDPGLRLPDHEEACIRSDLEWNTDALENLIAYGVETRISRGEEYTDLIDRRFFGARHWKYGRWCLKMALAVDDTAAASFYLQELVECVKSGQRMAGLTLEGARRGLSVDAELVSRFDELLEPGASVGDATKRPPAPESAAKRPSAVDTAEQQEWQEHIVAEAQALRAGLGAPQLLHRVAEAYLGIENTSVGSSPRERLRDLVGSRDDLVDLLLRGMEGCVVRDDLPGCDHVVRLFDQNRVPWLVLPFVAGLHSLERSGRLSDINLSERQACLAVTVLYMLPQQVLDPDTADGTGVPRPGWFRTLLRDKPALVADALTRSVAHKLATGVQPAKELRELAEAEDHREVAAIASLSVLDSFPSAETESALAALCWSLKAALQRCDWQSVGRVIEERLGRGDLAAEERGCWLLAGYLVAPRGLRRELLDLVEDDDGLKWLGRFVAALGFPQRFMRRFAAADFELFVAVLGAAWRIHPLPEGAYWATSHVIGALADDASVAATEALEAVRQMPEAEPWLPAIADARGRQTSKRREYEYRHGEIGQVVRTLDNRSPANAADLAALVCDEIDDLGVKIRDGNASPWREYWNVDAYNRPTDPKPEDACRDAILSDLQERLGRLRIDAQREGSYADEKRSDIRVSFGGFNVPVEIKRSCHDDLWTAGTRSVDREMPPNKKRGLDAGDGRRGPAKAEANRWRIANGG